MNKDNKFANDYSLQNTEIVTSRGLTLAEPSRFAKKYGSEKAYEALSLDLWQLLIQPDDIICDIGAHHGIYSLVAAQTNRAKAIYAYEPSVDNLAFIKNNIQLNKLGKKIEPRNVALSNEVGEVEFQITEASDNANINGHPNSPTLRTETVKTSTLDNDFNKTKLDLIKIDTDGHEPYILKGARQTFKNNPQLKMLIEFNPKCLRRSGHEPIKFLENLVKLNFELLLIDDIKNTIERITTKNELWPELATTPYFYNILCMPAEFPELQSFIDEHSKYTEDIKDLKNEFKVLEIELQKTKASKELAENRLKKIHSTKTWRYVVKPVRKTLHRK